MEMHEYLRAIGLASVQTKKQLKMLTDWVLEAPDRFRTAETNGEDAIAVAERHVADTAGVAVVGTVNESGNLIPEYYFPYLDSSLLSSDAPLSVEKQTAKNGYIGMADDERLNLSLIFSVRNVTDAARYLNEDPFANREFKTVSLTLLASDAMVILPISSREHVLKAREERAKRQSAFLKDINSGDEKAFERFAAASVNRFEKMMKMIENSDVYSVVESFFMPHGMESDRYYFLGTITSCREVRNHVTNERFYALNIDVNGVEFALAVHEDDLVGAPAEGLRIRGHAWMAGELRY